MTSTWAWPGHLSLAAVLLLGCGGSHSAGPRPANTAQRPHTAPLELTDPVDVVFPAAGRMWVADYKDDALVETGGAAMLRRIELGGGPNRLVLDRSGRMWAPLYNADEVVGFRVPSTGTQPQVDVRLRSPALSQPTGLGFDDAGWLWVTNQRNDQLVGFSPAQLRRGGAGKRVRLPGGAAAINEDVAFDAAGRAWVAQYQLGRVLAYRAKDLRAGRPRPRRVVALDSTSTPIDIALDTQRRPWAVDSTGAALWELGAGQPRRVTLPQTTVPHSATWDEQGRVWVTDPDGWLLRYPAAALRGGTARAELVAHHG